MWITRCTLVAIALVMLGCPPDRGNHPQANDIGGSYGEAVLNYRFFPYSNAYVAYLMLPREDDYACESGGSSGWYDDDQDFVQFALIRGGDVEWEGDYPSFYTADCESYGSYDYDEAQCVSQVTGYDPEGGSVSTNGASARIDRWDDQTVIGTVTYGEFTEGFRATNCGELDSYYYYDERVEAPGRPDEAGGEIGRSHEDEPRWTMLRFK